MWASLTYPPEAILVSGENPVYFGQVNRGESRFVNWTLLFTAGGGFTLDVMANGTKFTGEPVTVHGYASVTIIDNPPNISVLSPQNDTYFNSGVPLIYAVNETSDWMGFSLDGEANVTVAGNTTLYILDGSHSLVMYANDTAGNMGLSDTVYFTVVDTTPPTPLILSPENRTYGRNEVLLEIVLDEPVSWIAYSLDAQTNVTITGNTTFTLAAEGSHDVTVFATDLAGNTGKSDTRHFSYEMMHDVATIEIKTSKHGCLPMEVVGQGMKASVYVTVENRGSYLETFNVTAYANSTEISHGEVTLASGATEVMVFEWNVGSLQRGNYTLSAQASPVPEETFLDDNSIIYTSEVCVSIPGDVDGDGDVDIFDITSMAAIYGVVKPNPAYSPNRDLDDDGDVDIFDVVTAAFNYGQSWVSANAWFRDGTYSSNCVTNACARRLPHHNDVNSFIKPSRLQVVLRPLNRSKR